jgi:hypothetical protein
MEFNYDNLPYRFNLEDVEKWKAFLEEHGYVSVSNVLTLETSKSSVEEIRKVLAKLSPNLSLDDDSTWAKSENYPFLLHGGMNQYIGHTKFQWDLREQLTRVFSKAWGVEPTELATSIDGFCYMDGRRGYEPASIIDTAHSDQAPIRNGLWSYQGIVNLCDCGPEDGGFVCIPDTHKIHPEFFKKIGKETHQWDWYKFTDENKKDPIFQNAIKINGKAGDVFLFDSRTFHCNTRPSSSNIRACVYICQIPKDRVPEEKKKERLQAWNEKRCSSHHPGDGFRLFPLLPKEADKKLAEIIPEISLKDEDLTDLQKSLICAE